MKGYLCISFLYSYGELSKAASNVFGGEFHFSKQELLIEQLINTIDTTNEKTALLVKGSRSAKMEHIVRTLISHYNNKKKG